MKKIKKLTHTEIELIITALEINRDQLHELATQAKKLQQVNVFKDLKDRAAKLQNLINEILDVQKNI